MHRASLSAVLKDFLAKPELRKHLVLSSVLLQCGGTASGTSSRRWAPCVSQLSIRFSVDADGELLERALQGLADCLLQAFDAASLERDITESDIKRAMRWYGEAVDDVVADFAAEVARRKSEAAAIAQRQKKRRISPGTDENRCVSWPKTAGMGFTEGAC